VNIGREIIAEVLQSRNIKPYLDAGMTAAWVRSDASSVAVFADLDKQAWLHLCDHWRTHKTVSPDLFRRTYTTADYRLPKEVHKPGELIEAAQDDVTSLFVGELGDDLVDLHEDSRWKDVLPTLQRAIQRVQKGIKDTAETADLMWDFDLEATMSAELEMGVPIGIDLIDEAFLGLQPSMLGVLVGRQKSTKSTIMLHSALQAWDAGFDVLFYSVELDKKFLRERYYSLGAGVSPDRFRRGKLKDTEKDRLRVFDKTMRSSGTAEFRISHKTALVTMDDLIAESNRYRPHVIYVDGFYFMQDRMTKKSAGSDWQANENLAAELKAFAMAEGISIFASTQAQEKQQGKKNTEGIEARTIMGGTGLLKAGDLVLGSNKTPDGILINEMLNRFSPVPDVLVKWDWDTMTMATEEYIDRDAERNRQRDEFVSEMEKR
jgi:hypothetical protein